MNLKDKNNRITLRVNQEQFNFIKEQSTALGVSPSQFLRMAINSMMITYQQGLSQIGEKISNVEKITDLSE